MSKQILNVKDVMAAANGYITIPGKVPKAYFEEKVYGVHVTE